MMQSTESIASDAIPAAQSAGQDGDLARSPFNCPAFLLSQLAAADLETIATKLATGVVLELEDAALLGRSSLPLLGRLLHFCPATANQKSESVLPIEQVSSESELPRLVCSPLSDWDAFCRALLDLRRELEETAESVAWYLEVSCPPDETGSSPDNCTGVEVLRATALARLLLPANVQVVAPLALLGPKLAQVALEFGADHLGYAGTDGQIFDNPLLADRSILEELQNSCSPTALKDET